MFLGEYRHTLDSKNRLRLPSKLKKEFSGEIVLTKGSDGCIFVLPKDNFDNVFSHALSLPMFDSTAQKPLRMLFSSATSLEEDNQGRFLLPASLKSYASIDKDVVFIGAGSRVEIWSNEKWEEYASNYNFNDLNKGLSSHGI